MRRLIPASKSLFHSNGLGLPIGNLTSQFFANVYLNELDQFVTKPIDSGGLDFSRYVRYVDDFVIVDSDQARLRSAIKPIDLFLRKHLHLALHPHKIRLQPTKHGVDFVGYFIKTTHTLVRQRIVRRFKTKLRHAINPEDGFMPTSDISMVQSYLGHFSHANAYRLRKKLCSFD